jgi:hypothetical protein
MGALPLRAGVAGDAPGRGLLADFIENSPEERHCGVPDHLGLLSCTGEPATLGTLPTRWLRSTVRPASRSHPRILDRSPSRLEGACRGMPSSVGQGAVRLRRLEIVSPRTLRAADHNSSRSKGHRPHSRPQQRPAVIDPQGDRRGGQLGQVIRPRRHILPTDHPSMRRAATRRSVGACT